MTKLTDLTALTTPALTDVDHIVDVDDTTHDAAGTSKKILRAYAMRQYAGTAFPTSNLWDGMPFHRTDIGAGLACFYDETNTQWLSKAHFYANVRNITYSATATSEVTYYDNQFSWWVERVSAQLFVTTTHSSGNDWTVDFETIGDAANSTTILSINSWTDIGMAGSVWDEYGGTPSTQNPTYYGGIRVSVTKNGSPGNLIMRFGYRFRLIVT